MKKKYRHLRAEERAVIMIESGKNTSVRAIGRLLGRSASTITRNWPVIVRSPRDAAAAARADRARRERSRRARKLRAGSELYWRVHHHLVYRHWSPQQIAARLREMHPDPDLSVSHETIYAAIYTHPRGGLKQAMVEALCQEKPPRGMTRKTLARNSFVPEGKNCASFIGLSKSKHGNGPGTGKAISSKARSIVPAWERWSNARRKTRFVMLCRMDGCTAEDALEGFPRQMKKLPAFLRESLTYDGGTEMTCHVELARRLDSTSGLQTHTRPGSAAATKTPMACYASSCPKAWTCRVSRRRS